MKNRCVAYAYVVKACLRTASGSLLDEPDTICFDYDLALQIAENERHNAAGLAVYAIGFDGRLVFDCPLICHGISVPVAGPASPALA